jgi:hypothetical protein
MQTCCVEVIVAVLSGIPYVTTGRWRRVTCRLDSMPPKTWDSSLAVLVQSRALRPPDASSW